MERHKQDKYRRLNFASLTLPPPIAGTVNCGRLCTGPPLFAYACRNFPGIEPEPAEASMELMQGLLGHRSIRRYRPDPIPDETLNEILHAGTRASTSGNMQIYSIIVTRDAKRRRTLWEYHGEQDMILQAPVVLTFCIDWNRMSRWCRTRDTDPGYDNYLSFLVGFADALIAAQNVALAAEGFGLGICYMGTTLCCPRQLIEFFGLPAGVFPATSMVMGYPDEDPARRARLPRESIVHSERYADFGEDRITEAYRSREVEGWERYMSIPRVAEAIRRSGVENLAQVYTQVKYPRRENESLSRDLLQAMRLQGFLDPERDLPA
jgi:nitroreductase